MARITRLNHVSITVADLDRSLSFWRDLVGLGVLRRGEAAAPWLDQIIGFGPCRLLWAELAIPGGTVLELFQYLEPEGARLRQRTCDPGSVHICLECDDVEAMLARLRAAGVVSRSPQPVEIPEGDWAGSRDVYLVDPDGVTFELTEAAR